MQTKNILHFLWQNVHSAAIICPDFFKKRYKTHNIGNNTSNLKVYNAERMQSLR